VRLLCIRNKFRGGADDLEEDAVSVVSWVKGLTTIIAAP